MIVADFRFIPSEVNWKEKGMVLRQETAFPSEEKTSLTITVEEPLQTTIYLRYPSWSGRATVSINGQKVAVKQKPGSYIALTRQWKNGDCVEVTYPMQVHIETTPDNPNKGALLYGPVVLAGERGTENMKTPASFSNPALYNDYYTYDYQIPADLKTTLPVDRKHPERILQRVGKELKFTTPQGDVIRPLYDVHRQRYVVYWDLHKEKIRNTISSNTITSFLYDNGIQWVGTQFGGVSYTPSTKARFFCYSKNDFYTADYKVRSFYMFPDGNKLIGTRAGLFHVSEKDGTVRKYSLENHSSKLRSNIILFINKVDDKILIGTYGGGMHVFDEKTLQLGDLSEEEPFLYGCFFHFTQDKAGHLWIASQEGLYQSTADGHILKKYDTMNSLLTTNAVFYVYADSMDRLWIGTKFGLFLMDIKSGKLRTDCFGTPITDEVKCIIEDSHKDIWVCSRSGLYRIGEDLQVADHFTKENLLPDDQVMSILEDRQGNYWIATCEEVVKYTPSENKHCTYQMQNEIDDLDFNNAVVMFADSTVWWTNEGGLIYTSEKNISVTKKLAANPTITSCYVGDVEYDFPYMDQSRGIVLPESGNSIRFKFSNLDYSLPNANVYEYRLEGYDKDWIKQNGVNEVTYKDLPSGKYVFKLRVPDGDVMTEQQTVVVVRKSYSFLIGLFLVAVLIAILIVYFSSKIWKLKRRMTNERIILSTVKEQGKAKKTVLPEVKVNSLLDNLLSYMENEKPYLSAKLNISDVSMKLDCTEIELSQLLNNHLNVNFSNFINTYRVNEIKHRLNQDNLSKYTLKALSEQCGFSSKTTFYRVFKNVTGMTPLEYCKRENLVIAEI